MLIPWLNQTIQVQRRSSNPNRNTLNEPMYGVDTTWTIVYPSVPVRIEFVPEQVQWKESGERVNPDIKQTQIYFEPQWILIPQDRITFLNSNDPSLVSRFYIVVDTFSEWNAVGNTHHRVAQIQVH